MSYTLTISIDPTSVQQIVAAGQYVTLVQAVQPYVQSSMFAAFASAAGAPLAIAWLTFSPYPVNTVTWAPSYLLYASQAAPGNGQPMQPLATQSAAASMLYPFQANTFGAPAPQSGGGYFVQNLQGTSMTFGLALAATVNQQPQSAAPINTSTVLNNEIGWFTPLASVAVFLSTIATNGTPFYLLGAPTFYAMSGGSVSLQYQAATSSFVQINS